LNVGTGGKLELTVSQPNKAKTAHPTVESFVNRNIFMGHLFDQIRSFEAISVPKLMID
jgi:hypothetical protein